MGKKLELNPEILNLEYDRLIKELNDLDDLYEMAKKDLDTNRKYVTRGSNTFIANQTANLISIKEKRLNIIKELSNIKKNQIEIKAKEFNTNNKIEDNESGYSKEVLDIYKLLSGTNRIDLIQQSLEENPPELEYSDKELDDILNERINEGNIDNNIKKKKEQKLPDGYSIVVTKDKEKYIIDSDYNIIEDCEYDLSLINIIKFDVVGEDEYGYDEEGNAYEVVEL